MNLPPRFRFKLERLRRDLEQWWMGIRYRAGGKEAGHRMCPSCRALVGRDDSTCPLCGARLKSAAPRSVSPGLLGGVLPMPSTATSALAAINIGLYALTLYLSFQAAQAEMTGTPGFGGVRVDVLVDFGAKWGPGILRGDEWWRLVTATFLHGNLMHIGFNMWVLLDMGPQVEELFQTPKFLVMYLVAGVNGFLLSLFWSPGGISVGASGAILGLVGVLIGASFHHGRTGAAYRASLFRWFIYILIFGLFLRVDNAAHIGGVATGALLGYLIPEGEPETPSEEKLWNFLAVISVLIMAASFVFMALNYTSR
ncbi:MAG: rhomboid family intramembrane serine protease [Acidobacteria bacterium]|nr:rhomboid family intramembrane serine protease [Acidobacteriota bacterium]